MTTKSVSFYEYNPGKLLAVVVSEMLTVPAEKTTITGIFVEIYLSLNQILNSFIPNEEHFTDALLLHCNVWHSSAEKNS